MHASDRDVFPLLELHPFDASIFFCFCIFYQNGNKGVQLHNYVDFIFFYTKLFKFSDFFFSYVFFFDSVKFFPFHFSFLFFHFFSFLIFLLNLIFFIIIISRFCPCSLFNLLFPEIFENTDSDRIYTFNYAAHFLQVALDFLINLLKKIFRVTNSCRVAKFHRYLTHYSSKTIVDYFPFKL